MRGVESRVTTEAREPNGGLVVIPDAFTVVIAALAARYHVPVIYWSRSFAEAGGLVSTAFTSSKSTDVPAASSRLKTERAQGP